MLKTVINHIGSWRFTPNLNLPKSLYAANGHPVPPRDRGRGMAMACPEAAAASIVSTLFKPFCPFERLPLVTIVLIPLDLAFVWFLFRCSIFFSHSEYRLSELAPKAVGPWGERYDVKGWPPRRYALAIWAKRAVCGQETGRSASWTNR